MVRDWDALKIEKWAANGDVQDPEDGGLDRSTGWDATYSQPGGNVPKREHFNQIIRELSALGVEVNIHGLLGWDPSISYQHPALVMGSDAKPYLSVADSIGIDPTADTTESSWTLFEAQGPPGAQGLPGSDADVPLASTAVAGKVQLATAAETETGTDSTSAVTPAGLAAVLPGNASETQAGLVELATQAETLARASSNRAITPAGLSGSIAPSDPTDVTDDNKLLTWGVARAAFLEGDDLGDLQARQYTTPGNHSFTWDYPTTKAIVVMKGGDSGEGGGGGGGGAGARWASSSTLTRPAGGAGGNDGDGSDSGADGDDGRRDGSHYGGGGGGQGGEGADGGRSRVTIGTTNYDAKGGDGGKGGGGGGGGAANNTNDRGGNGGAAGGFSDTILQVVFGSVNIAGEPGLWYGRGGRNDGNPRRYGLDGFPIIVSDYSGGSGGIGGYAGDFSGDGGDGADGGAGSKGEFKTYNISGLTNGRSISVTVGGEGNGGGGGGGGESHQANGTDGSDGADGEDGWVAIIPDFS